MTLAPWSHSVSRLARLTLAISWHGVYHFLGASAHLKRDIFNGRFHRKVVSLHRKNTPTSRHPMSSTSSGTFPRPFAPKSNLTPPKATHPRHVMSWTYKFRPAGGYFVLVDRDFFTLPADFVFLLVGREARRGRSTFWRSIHNGIRLPSPASTASARSKPTDPTGVSPPREPA